MSRGRARGGETMARRRADGQRAWAAGGGAAGGGAAGAGAAGPAPCLGVLALDVRSACLYQGHGIGTYTSELLAAMPLCHEGHPVRGVAPCARIRPGGLLNAGGFALEGRLFWRWASLPGTESGDEAVWHNPHSGLGLPERLRAPAVITVHDLIPLVMPDRDRSEFVALFAAQVPRAVERAARVIAVSEHTKSDLVRILGVPESRITVIAEAARHECRPLEPDAARARVAARTGLRAPYALYLGGFSRRKNLGTLVRAYRDALRDLPAEHTLVLAGAPERTHAQVRELAHRVGCPGRVAFLGHVAGEDLAALYGAADLFVYPSLYEGFGLPPLEAMACGCPVVCSGSTSLGEVCGDAALLVDATDPGELAGAMVRVALDRELAAELRRRGLERASLFSWDRAAQRTLEVYSAALA